MRRLSIATLVGMIGLAGCASLPTAPRLVRVPVAVQCRAPMPAVPALPVAHLTPADTDRAVARAYVESLILLRADDTAVRGLLSACTHG